jgi:hypothetical protein
VARALRLAAVDDTNWAMSSADIGKALKTQDEYLRGGYSSDQPRTRERKLSRHQAERRTDFVSAERPGSLEGIPQPSHLCLCFATDHANHWRSSGFPECWTDNTTGPGRAASLPHQRRAVNPQAGLTSEAPFGYPMGGSYGFVCFLVAGSGRG